MQLNIPQSRKKQFLLVLVDDHATSFCQYEGRDMAQSKLMDYTTLKQTIKHAHDHGVVPQFILGNTCLPDAYEAQLAKIEHIRIVPISHPANYANSVMVINPNDYENLRTQNKVLSDIVILRVSKDAVGGISEIVIPLLSKCKRLNVSLLDIEHYSEADIAGYKEQLGLIGNFLAEKHKTKQAAEINVLTDRLILRRMNNCNAGIEHMTIAPDGRLYVCPAFYYAGEPSVGHIAGDGAVIPNKQLLDIEHAPICSLCDAFHCKRCVFLNKRLTLEVNTPSWQQCKVAHNERAASRIFLSKIDWPIPKIDYDDPFILLKKKMEVA
jgi:CXXX repeat peptide maturase